VEAGAPASTGNAATDSINWFNFRRQQTGLSALVRNSALDAAAQGHSNYQKLNNVITHVQSPDKPGFTGRTLADRLAAAGYRFTQSSYAYGEVIASTSDTSGFHAAEDLIAAIYHRFVAFEPLFREIGSGAATIPDGNTYFTTNFAANGLGAGLAGIVMYPFPGQQRLPLSFLSDNESPDPVSGKNEVGYPISVHANITATLLVERFSIQPIGGDALPAHLLAHASDKLTPMSAAAIIPLAPLASGTTYEVQFTGLLDGERVSRAWSFTTQ
jgi:hypothetical protein